MRHVCKITLLFQIGRFSLDLVHHWMTSVLTLPEWWPIQYTEWFLFYFVTNKSSRKKIATRIQNILIITGLLLLNLFLNLLKVYGFVFVSLTKEVRSLLYKTFQSWKSRLKVTFVGFSQLQLLLLLYMIKTPLSFILRSTKWGSICPDALNRGSCACSLLCSRCMICCTSCFFLLFFYGCHYEILLMWSHEIYYTNQIWYTYHIYLIKCITLIVKTDAATFPTQCSKMD